MDPEALERWFAESKRILEEAYLRHDDAIRQSGFGGGPIRWRSERGPILGAINGDGDILDVGCANGHLLECLVLWGRERGVSLVPYGVDFSEKFITLARRRLSSFASHFWVANAWDWIPPRRFRFVYALVDSVPNQLMGAYVLRLVERYVEPRGRLIAGSYGSRHRNEKPLDVPALLMSVGLRVAGTEQGGDPVVTRFAWTDHR